MHTEHAVTFQTDVSATRPSRAVPNRSGTCSLDVNFPSRKVHYTEGNEGGKEKKEAQ